MALRRLYSVSVGKTQLLPTSSHYPACIFAHHSACESGASTNSCDVPVDIKFQDPRTANLSKTNMDIVRGLFVFRLCSMPFLVRHNKKLMELGRRLLGRSLFRSFMKMTFYGHFVGGENIESINQVIARIRKFGVKSILDYSVEKDIDETEAVERVKYAGFPFVSTASQFRTNFESLAEVVREPKVRPAAATREYQTSLQFADRSQNVIAARTYFYESEYQCDTNMEIFLRCIDYVTSSTKKEGFAAIKLTALGRPQLLLQMSDLLVQMQRLFYLLVGCTKTNSTSGYNRPSLDMDNFRKRLESLGVEISYDENVKWFTLLDVSGDGVVDLLDWSHLKSIEHDLAHIFSVKNKQTGKMEQLVPTLTADGLKQMRNMLKRMDTIAKHAQASGVRVMVDAEQTYFQPAIRRLTMEMMRLFNRESAVIFNTYQCYLKDAHDTLQHDLHQAETENFYFGAKLVRGAYMDQERARSSALDYPDPICASFDDTTKMYESCILEVLRYIKQRSIGQVSVMMATHNEDTIRFALQKMREYNISPQQRVICFGQLYGMCDRLSFPLGQGGYSVYKYVPYGPVDEVLPYLSRRAMENGSILSNTKLERQLMWRELKRRIASGDFLHRL